MPIFLDGERILYMITSNERKKLSAKIARLERDSINYFDVEREYFLIDSDNLHQVRPRLYGYSIQASGIYENDNLTPEAAENLGGRGAYVYVDVRGGQITIKQDLNGSWGIYLFRHGDYFALSNSFFRLVDHLKFRYPLTVNRDYCHHLLIVGLCSMSCTETAVNEIRLIERNAIIHIGIAEKNLQMELIDGKEQTVRVDSAEGMAILDNWVNFWSGVFRGVAQNAKYITADLSGGFDSRLSLMLLLNSGIDLKRMTINSINDKLHTHAEDYAIASQIAAHYGFELNRPLPELKFLNYSLTDVFNMDLYHLQTLHRDGYIKIMWKKSVDKLYSVSGHGGESLRDYWFGEPKKFLDGKLGACNVYSPALSRELAHSTKTIFESSFRFVREKYKVADENSPWIPQYAYGETWNRHHFGKFLSGAYFCNSITLAPVFDPELLKLRVDTPECPDPKLLITVIFTRFKPELLQFPFDSNRSIAPDTIAFAKRLNERFPRQNAPIEPRQFNLPPRDVHVEQILASNRNNEEITKDMRNACLKAMFDSSRTYGLFTTQFDAELYNYAVEYYLDPRYTFTRNWNTHVVLGIAQVLEAVEISNRHRAPYRDFARFLEQDFAEIPAEAQIVRKFSPYFTVALQITFLQGTSPSDLEILDISDNKADTIPLDKLQTVGYMIFSHAGSLDMVFQAATDGQIQLVLFGADVPSNFNDTKRVPLQIDYTNLTINGAVAFNTAQPACYDKPCVCTVDVAGGEKIVIHTEWLPHVDS